MFSLRNFVQASFRFSTIKQLNHVSAGGFSNMQPKSASFFSMVLARSFTLLNRSVHTPLTKLNLDVLSQASTINASIQKNSPVHQQIRSVTKWSLKKGKRKTVKAVIHRFYRLGWDAWIRPMVGRNKKHWCKPAKRKIQAEKHVFCNSTQSTLLDKMVTKYWRKRRFYVDDIYEPYHQREEYSSSAVKPH